VIPPILIGLGLLALALGAAILRSFGPGYRIGRLLSATPTVAVEEAVALAARHEVRYVSVTGRIDSETDFEDEHHRPLVLRRTRLEARRDGGWQTIDERREAVEFEVQEGLAAIGIDHEALGDGLVVIPRESAGLAREVDDRLPIALPGDTPVRLRVDQVSSVEHAIVVGIPSAGPDGRARMTAGGGRPLILTTLERDEAMRVLARGSRARPAAAAASLVSGIVLVAVGIAWGIVEAIA
jgi:hypothetical protein